MLQQEQTGHEHRYVERIGRDLEEWLARPDWTLDEAHDWLQGNRLPPVGPAEGAFVWILHGLLYTDERGRAEAELARRLARVLSERPDVTPRGRRPEALLHNLFMLCAGLGHPDVLGEPLLAVYEGRKLAGRWMGTDLRVALTAALIPNQTDKRLLPVWQTMIEGRGDAFLVGSLAHGLDGVTFLPGAEPGEPPLKEIGAALREVSRRLQDEFDQRPAFERYVERVVRRYPGLPAWNEELIRLADEYGWPDWALVSLPSLWVRLERSGWDGRRRFYAWKVYLPLVTRFGREFGFEPEIKPGGLCQGKVYELGLPEEAARYFAPLMRELEESRRPCNIPLPTYSAVVGAVTDRMSELELLPSERMHERPEGFDPSPEVRRGRVPIASWPVSVLAQARRDILLMNRAGASEARAES